LFPTLRRLSLTIAALGEFVLPSLILAHRRRYWVSLITYLADTDMDWAVWAFYGATRYEKVEGEGGRLVNMTYPETYGLMNEDYSDTQFAGNDGGDWRIQDMQAVMPQNPDISGLELKATDGVW